MYNGYDYVSDEVIDAPTIIEVGKEDYENDDYYKGAQEEL